MNREERNTYMREWNKNHYHSNLEESRMRAREWYHKNKERIKEIRRERSKSYKQKNPDKVKAYNSYYSKTSGQKIRVKQWRDENKEWIANYNREYKKNHRNERAEYERKRRAKKAGCWGNVPVGLWRKILDFYGNRCLCCGTSDDLTQDHVIPLNLGGQHVASNLQPLCGHCNSRKQTKTIDYRNGRIFAE